MRAILSDSARTGNIKKSGNIFKKFAKVQRVTENEASCLPDAWVAELQLTDALKSSSDLPELEMRHIAKKATHKLRRYHTAEMALAVVLDPRIMRSEKWRGRITASFWRKAERLFNRLLDAADLSPTQETAVRSQLTLL